MSSTKSTLHRTFGIDVAAHGDLSNTQLNRDDTLQVIALGLSRTGTTSLQAALIRLGFGPSHQGVDLFRSPSRTEAFIDLDKKLIFRTWKAGDPALNARLQDLMRGYRSSTDNPINTIPDEIYAAFPNAKYILTTRSDDAAGWWKSLHEAVGWHFRRDIWRYVFRFLIYPVQFLRRTDDKVQGFLELWKMKYGVGACEELYALHNQHVRRLVPKASLLEYDVREGWGPLCRFLEVEVPEEEFPQLNEAGAMRAIYWGMMGCGAATWMVYAAAVAGAACIAVRPGIARDLVNRAVETGRHLFKSWRST